MSLEKRHHFVSSKVRRWQRCNQKL